MLDKNVADQFKVSNVPTLIAAQRRFARMENEVQQALTVMDKETGKLLNYRQLMRHSKYKKEWSTSTANEFGRLAQGVSGRIKGTNIISFIH